MRRRKVLINGIGCPESGGLQVLNQFLRSIPPEIDGFAVVPPAATGTKVPNLCVPDLVSRTFLRMPFEVIFGLLISASSRHFILNLSNYGFWVRGPQVLLMHNPALVEPGSRFSLTRLAKDSLLRWSLARSHLIIVQTEHMRQALVRGAQSRGWTLAPVAVFTPRASDWKWQQFKRPLDKTMRLFYPASRFPYKRTDLAVAAVRFFATRSAGKIHLQITSHGVDDEAVCFLGKIDPGEVARQFHECHALLFTSEMETLGLPLLEALSVGKPAVLPRLPYAEELYGDAAIYYDGAEPAAVADAIHRLMTNYDDLVARAAARMEMMAAKCLTYEQQWREILSRLPK